MDTLKKLLEFLRQARYNPELCLLFLVVFPPGVIYTLFHVSSAKPIDTILNNILSFGVYFGWLAICVIAYIAFYEILSRLPLRKDKFVIRIANFQPVDPDAVGASKRFPYLLKKEIEALGDTEIDVRLLHVDIKGQNEIELKPLAKKIGRRHRAHMVIFGDVCCTAGMGCSANGDYDFEPVIVLTEGAVFDGVDNSTISGMDYIPQPYKNEKETRDTVRFILGLKKYAATDYAAARDIFLSLPGGNADIFFFIGNTELFTGNYEAAVAAYDETIRLQPDYVDMYINKGVALGKLGKYEEAINCYDEVIGLKPFFAEAHNNKGVALGKRGRHEEACTCFDEAIRLKPGDYGFYYNKGCALGDLGKYDEAIESFADAIRLKRDFDKAYNNIGAAHGKLGRHNKALTYYNKTISLNPLNAEAHINKIAALRNLGELDKSKVAFERAMEIIPNFPPPPTK